MTIGFVFSCGPFGTVSGREGLDAVLATSNYSEDLALFFIGDGVMQLLSDQNPSSLLCKDHVKMFRMLPMCDVENIYLCKDSLKQRGLQKANFVLDVEMLSVKDLTRKLTARNKVLHF